MGELNKTKKILIINTDGGSRGNPGQAACAFVIKRPNGEVIKEGGEAIGVATNNVAEYMGVIKALSWIKENIKEDVEEFHFYLDSALIVNQLGGKFKINDIKLKRLVILEKSLEKSISSRFVFRHIPRLENREADFLVNKFLDLL